MHASMIYRYAFSLSAAAALLKSLRRIAANRCASHYFMAIAVGREMKRGIIQRNRKCSVPLRAEGGILRRSRFSVIGAVALLTACGGSRSTSFEAPIASEVASPASAYERVLYSFAGGNDGSDPASAPVMIDGTLYGTTLYGGGGSCSGYSPGCGIVYAIDGAGNERVLHAFQGGEDGATPNGPLVTVKGKLVGTTARGGGSECNNGPKTGCGTVFEIHNVRHRTLPFSVPR